MNLPGAYDDLSDGPPPDAACPDCGLAVPRDAKFCPHCGGLIELDETDHLIACPYCGVKSLLFIPDYFRLALPHNARGQNIIHILVF